MQNGTCDIGLIGLAVMGQNLVLNMNDHGFKVAVFNRTVSKVDEFLAHEAKGTQVEGTHSIKELVSALKEPRRVMLMVKAGDTVDQMIDHVAPLLAKGDIIIDGGNRFLPIPIAAPRAWPKRVFCLSALAFRAAKKARVTAPPSCPAVIPMLGPISKKFFRGFPPK
jgi:6-phosphogluconate dehydrogenase